MFLRSINVAFTGGVHLFLLLSIHLYGHIKIWLFFYWWIFKVFPVLAVTNKATKKKNLYTNLHVNVNMSGRRIFNCIRNCHTIFQNGSTILRSHQQCMRVPVAPLPCPHLILSVFLILAILIDAQWYHTVVLICISLVTNDVEHFFIVYWSFVFLHL